MRRPCRLMLHGLLRVFPVLHRPGRVRTSRTRPPAAPSAAPEYRAAANAKQRRLRQAFIARPPPHPSHSFVCEGPPALKTLRGPRSSTGYAYQSSIGTRTGTGIRSMPVLVLVRVACTSPRKARVFAACPSHAQLCEGCGGGGCEKRCRRRVFQGLRRRQTGSARSVDEGASPSP